MFNEIKQKIKDFLIANEMMNTRNQVRLQEINRLVDEVRESVKTMTENLIEVNKLENKLQELEALNKE